jgi:hypothetical protein
VGQVELMTARAFSLFVVQVCATKAREQPFRWRTFFTLLRECVSGGRANAVIVGHLVALFTLSARTRQRVRRLWERVRRERIGEAEIKMRGSFALRARG